MNTYSRDALLVASRQELIDTIEQLTDRVTELTMHLDWFKRQVFGEKSERYIPDDDQQIALELGITANDESEANVRSTVKYERRKKSKKTPVGHGRGQMPTHLPVKNKVIEPEGDLSGFVRIGEEVSWYYEMEKPMALHVVRLIRPKYAHPGKDGVVTAELPALPVEKGNAGPGLISKILVDKFINHLPLDRQRKIYKSDYDADFAESWLSNTVKNGVFWLTGVYEAYRGKILSSGYLQADETPIPVLTKDKKGRTHRGYFWVYHDPLLEIVIFDYRKSRSREGPNGFLSSFRGILQIDGYEGYNEIIGRNNLTRAACMDHVRRRFERALEYDTVRATHALDVMREWYGCERDARERGLQSEEKLALRREKIVPAMEAFEKWMQEQLMEVLPKSPIGTALSYALNQWPHFKAYQNDARVELSNILIENAIRPVALGRKNFLFAGSHDAAQWAAVVYSLAATAKWHGCEPFVYFKELLTKLPGAMQSQIESYLLPEWKPGDTPEK